MKLFDRMEMVLIGAALKTRRFFKNEEGDTNFISILIILAIALSVAAVFIKYKDNLLVWVDNMIPDIFKQ